MGNDGICRGICYACMLKVTAWKKAANINTSNLSHTHTLGFHVYGRLFTDIMIFIPYILSPNPNPTHHRKLSAFYIFKKKTPL